MSKRTKLLMKENNEAQRLLSSPSICILYNIQEYLRSAPISACQRESVRRDVIQMLSDAEARGETPTDVIGEDYKSFCDSITAGLPRPAQPQFFLGRLRDALPAILALYAFLCAARFNVKTGWYASVKLGDLPAAAFALLMWSGPGAWLSRKIHTRQTLAKTVRVLFDLLVLTGMVVLGLLLPQQLFQIHLLAALVPLAALFVVYKLLDAKLD